MFEGAVERLGSGAVAVEKQLRTSERLRDIFATEQGLCAASPACTTATQLSSDPPDSVEWRVIDHCSAVTRLYALYEQFAHEMLREHLSLLERQFRFTELDSALQNAYRVGVAKILEKKEGPRFEDIVLTDLLGGFHKAASGETPYRLEPKALLIHEQNLRLPMLAALYQECGVDGLSEWIAGHPEIEEFFSAAERMHSSAEVELRTLIDYRNEAAHGGLDVDDVLAVDALCEFADFIKVLCRALAERIQLAALQTGLSRDQATEVGTVSETFQGGRVIIAAVAGKFSIGESIYLISPTQCAHRRIESIQLDDVPHDQVDIADATELGFRLSGRARVGQRIVRLTTAPPPSPPLGGDA